MTYPVHGSDATQRVSGREHLDAAQRINETHRPAGGVITLPAGQPTHDGHSTTAGSTLDGGQSDTDTHARRAPVNTLPLSHNPPATRYGSAEGDLPAADPGPTTREPTPLATHDALLLILADALDDLERTRITTQNRLRSLGQVKGLEDSREARTMQLIAETLAEMEHKATLDLQRAMRAHPLGPWVKRTVGIGEKQGARLIAAIGDPAARSMPSQLWQYCGHGAPSKRKRGEKTFWNPTAKMRLHLIAESCMKQRTSPYRAVYDEARMDWATRDTSDGHKHNHALRMVGKAILLDLWREARKENSA